MPFMFIVVQMALQRAFEAGCFLLPFVYTSLLHQHGSLCTFIEHQCTLFY